MVITADLEILLQVMTKVSIFLLLPILLQVNIVEYALDTIEQYQEDPAGLRKLIDLQVSDLASLLSNSHVMVSS